MQKQIDKMHKRLDHHDKRLTLLERILWVFTGLVVGVTVKNPIILLELITK